MATYKQGKAKTVFYIAMTIVLSISFLSIAVNNVYSIVYTTINFNQDEKLIKELEQYNDSWEEIKSTLEKMGE